ncbi:MAG: hypothetical protein QOD37_1474 [Gaiellales bacterium]|nr:hypothetical protein [Gaiellales bacterium]MDX6571990.1 hypothetical protein [Gaiellales bacterium]
MNRRVPIRLVRLLAVACACLAPAAAAQAAVPQNDIPTTAQDVGALGWTSLSVSQDIVVPATDWGDATTGPEDADPLPSCTGAPGFKSMWYAVSVPEASVLKVTVISTDTTRYQPVVTILAPGLQDEVACGVLAVGRAGATANATAYVTPSADGTPAIYYVRIAQVTLQSPSAGLPVVTVRFAGRDVTPPHIVVSGPTTAQPKNSATYTAEASTDLGSDIDTASAEWQFQDRVNGRDVIKKKEGVRVSYTWRGSGARPVVFTVKDRAGNESLYRFNSFVEDTVHPAVSFSLRPPAPGAHRLLVVVKASESVHLRLLVTQVGRRKPLLRRSVDFWGEASHRRSIPLLGGVGKGILVITGVARDLAGNTTSLPQCVIDPVSGQGNCAAP